MPKPVSVSHMYSILCEYPEFSISIEFFIFYAFGWGGWEGCRALGRRPHARLQVLLKERSETPPAGLPRFLLSFTRVFSPAISRGWGADHSLSFPGFHHLVSDRVGALRCRFVIATETLNESGENYSSKLIP